MRSIKKTGFTLIELLVVVAVIALLIGLLLPALGKATTTAKELQSVANLRQIGLIFALYANEHKDFYPAAQDPVVADPLAEGIGDNSRPVWLWMGRGFREVLGEYADENYDSDHRNIGEGRGHIFYAPLDKVDSSDGEYDATSYSYPMNMYYRMQRGADGTPSGTLDAQGKPAEVLNTSNFSGITSLQIMDGYTTLLQEILPSGQETPYFDEYGNPRFKYGVRSQEVRFTQSKILCGEWGSYKLPSDDSGWKGWWMLDGERNFVFVDGHVEAYRPEEMFETMDGLRNPNFTKDGHRGRDVR